MRVRFVALTLCASLCAALCAAVSVAGPVSQVPSSRFSVSVNGHVLSVPYERNLSLAGSYPQIKRAVVLVHGTSRDADQAYENMADAASEAGVQSGTALLVAPQFLTEEDITAHALAPDVLFWSESGWKEGSASLNTVLHPRPASISDFAVMDSILYRIASRNPNLQAVTVAGHSAGAQFVNRYAAGNTVEQRLLSEFGVSVTYVVANPSSYLYFDAKRAEPGTTDVFAVPPASVRQSCPDYNEYKLGLTQLNAYMSRVSTSQLRSQYSSRHVTYLLGQLDANPADPSMDMSCGARLQGIHRLARGLIYQGHLTNTFGPSVAVRHRFEVIAGVGHSSSGMFTSGCGAGVLFGATSCPTVAVSLLSGRDTPELSLSLPNPLVPQAQIRFEIPHDGERVTLRIHDLLGRVVRTLVDSAQPAGPGTVLWDGRSERGDRVAPGMYICRLEQGGAARTTKLAVLP